MLENFWLYIVSEKEWIFSGVGVFVLSGIAAFVYKKRSVTSQKIKSGDGSTNIQAARDVHMKGD